MTYNFDPDKWQEDQLFMLRVRLKAGKITRAQYEAAVLELEEKLAEMWARLDGSYILGKEKDSCG